MAGIEQVGGQLVQLLSPHHGVGALRLRKLSSLGKTYRIQVELERVQSGNHVPERSGRGALLRLEETFDAFSSGDEVALK
jgi:hypothetical protein